MSVATVHEVWSAGLKQFDADYRRANPPSDVRMGEAELFPNGLPPLMRLVRLDPLENITDPLVYHVRLHQFQLACERGQGYEIDGDRYLLIPVMVTNEQAAEALHREGAAGRIPGTLAHPAMILWGNLQRATVWYDVTDAELQALCDLIPDLQAWWLTGGKQHVAYRRARNGGGLGG